MSVSLAADKLALKAGSTAASFFSSANVVKERRTETNEDCSATRTRRAHQKPRQVRSVANYPETGRSPVEAWPTSPGSVFRTSPVNVRRSDDLWADVFGIAPHTRMLCKQVRRRRDDAIPDMNALGSGRARSFLCHPDRSVRFDIAPSRTKRVPEVSRLRGP